MTITTLPLFDDPTYSYIANIERRSFQFKFNWNDRSAAWYMDLATDTGEAIMTGQKLVPDFAMTFDYQLQPYGLTGFFILMSSNAAQAALPITQPKELRERFTLQYVTTT
jgi:hypothetical protein